MHGQHGNRLRASGRVDRRNHGFYLPLLSVGDFLRKVHLLTSHYAKLKCNRERPECRRCQRINTKCVYPRPPDRKRLALERSKVKEQQRQSAESTASPHTTTPLSQTNKQSSPQQNGGSRRSIAGPAAALGAQFRPTTQEGLAAQPHYRPLPSCGQLQPNRNVSASVQVSKEVALFLIEIYFERHYQAHLLFRKRQLIDEYTTGAACPRAALAIFAFASLYVRHLSLIKQIERRKRSS